MDKETVEEIMERTERLQEDGERRDPPDELEEDAA
jgi:hypothetical protein